MPAATRTRTCRHVCAILAAATGCGLWPGGAQAGDVPRGPSYSLSAWAAENGQPPGDVFAIAQDVEGYLWLGTPSGLVRFDGTQFARWSSHRGTSLPNGPVHALVGDPDGSIWAVYGGGGGIVHITPDAAVRYTAADGAPPGGSVMIRDHEGAIWVAARRGVFRFFNGRWSVMTAVEGYPAAEAFSVYEDRAGRLWVGSAAGVYRRTGGRFELVDASATNVQGFAEDASGRVWVTDPNALVNRLPDRAAPKVASGVRLPAGGWRVLHDSAGQLWVAAFGSGLVRVRETSAGIPVLERFEYEHRLPGSPRALFEDREKNIWVGMRGGLLRLSPNSFVSVPRLEGLNNDGVRTAAVGQDGSIWVATSHALNRFRGDSHTVYSIAQTMALHVDRHGEVWISTSQQTGRLVNGTIVPAGIPAWAQPSRIMTMTTDGRGRLWLCSTLRGISVWDGRRLERFEGHPQVAARACQSIYTDRRDRVWVGFLSGGVAVYDGRTFEVFGEDDGLAGGTVLAVLQDRTGAMWFSTSRGLSRYANGRFTTLTPAHAPLADLVPVLVEDEAGGIWVGVNSGAGILRLQPSEVDKVAVKPSHRVEYAFFDESDGLQQGSQTWQAGVGGVRAPDGRLWVATGLGMAIIDPRNLPVEERLAPPRIDAVLADGRRLGPEPGLVLPSGIATLSVEYGAISLSSASKLRFRYMLEGVDDDWVYAGAAREATYSNLPSGEHRFRVSATSTGPWTEAAVWAFVVSPPFYVTRSFLFLSGAGIALVIAAAWWLRLRAVRSQYALVFAERARLSREIHDTLLQSLAAIGVELETIATELEPSQSRARDALRRLRRQVGRSVREARESIMELRHNPMEQRLLVDALQDLAAATTRERNIPTEFVLEGRPRKADPDIELQLLRIAQEGVQNAVKHARAGAIRVGLSYEPHRLVLRVSDDGCGFDPGAYDPPPASGEHLGLVTMRERAARVGGSVTISSSPGGGTTVETIVPLTATRSGRGAA